MVLSIGLPLTIAPLTMKPLIMMVNRQRELRIELERVVLTDGLTELPNRRAFFEFAPPAWTRGSPAETPVTAMMIDVDHFKAINDSYGHDAGDMVLKRIAATVTRDAVAAAGAPDWIGGPHRRRGIRGDRRAGSRRHGRAPCRAHVPRCARWLGAAP